MGLQLNPTNGNGALPFWQGLPDFTSLSAFGMGGVPGMDTGQGLTLSNIALPSPAVVQPAVPTTVASGGAMGGVTGQPISLSRLLDIAKGGDAAAGGAGPDQKGWFDKIGGIEGLGSIAKGLGDLGQLWGSIQGIKIARDQLRFNKESYATNLANQTQDYNTTLEGRTRQRFAFEGKSSGQADEYLKAHSL